MRLLCVFLFLSLFCLLDSQAFADSEIEEEETPKVLENPNSDIHGLFDVVFKNDYITPRGLLVTDTGLTTQVTLNISLDVYKNPCGWLNGVTLFAGIWNDICSSQHRPTAGQWNEFDWYAGFSLKYAKDWNVAVQYLELLSPPGNFKPEQNIEFTFSYDDSGSCLPLKLNPYVKFFWAVTGDSTVVVGKKGGTYDIEIGLVPTVELTCSPLPFMFQAPTWMTVGPPSFWNGGKFGLKKEKSHFGVFSTGLKAVVALDSVSKRLGKWVVDAGVQYYRLINDNLLEAQKFTFGAHSRKSAYRNVWVASTGFGFGF